uniref:Aspartyl/asparaginy/proline hydroxylase domain-containing protein n=1 Tax=Timema genevievae TaxID=629358 RepID=A0A7R9JNZ4_TIMGE|nr:unnamed protein product [Timema genevievae]
MFNQILLMVPGSLRALLGRTRSLDKLGDIHHSNALLDQTIQAYLNVLQMKDLLSDTLFKEIAYRCINRIIFRGHHIKAVPIHRSLIKLFPEDPHHSNQLAVTYLNINKMVEAKRVLTNILRIWPQNGFAMAHYGFVLKVGDNNIEKSVGFLRHGIASREPGTLDGRFFFQLGDALMRLGRGNEALEVYEQGVKEELFLSKYQRSLYNVKRLTAQPWWEPEQTNYSEYFKVIQDNWQVIRAEGMAALEEKHILFQDEAENLKEIGNWKQLELYVRGRRMDSSCAKVPQTCKLVANFPAARDCRRGQVKFSVMEPGTHIWPHCGPTNCRLRAHLGLVVPSNTYIRVAEETRTWEEGKILIFDDSFEHEVWHNGSTMRLVLIIDVWHPELTDQEKKSLPDI